MCRFFEKEYVNKRNCERPATFRCGDGRKLKRIAYICTPNFATMKEGIHPDNYRLVVFKDMSNEYAFLSKSAAETKETIQWEDGNEYPLVKVEVSHKSHPFYTGKAQFVDTAGRIDKFRQKYGKFDKKANKE